MIESLTGSPNMRKPKHIVIGLSNSSSRSPGPDNGPFFVKYLPYAVDIDMPRDHPSSAVALAVTTPETAACQHPQKVYLTVMAFPARIICWCHSNKRTNDGMKTALLHRDRQPLCV